MSACRMKREANGGVVTGAAKSLSRHALGFLEQTRAGDEAQWDAAGLADAIFVHEQLHRTHAFFRVGGGSRAQLARNSHRGRDELSVPSERREHDGAALLRDSSQIV